ncbi:MAG: DNA-processing protein DprA [Solirubrobacterales bacterium]
MTSNLSRDDIIAALIRHPSWDLDPVRVKDVWAMNAGEEVAPESRSAFENRLEGFDRAHEIAAGYEEQGIWIVTAADEAFPDRLTSRLGQRAPALIYGFGSRELLAHDGIGVVGSRNVSPDGERVTQELASAAAEASRTVISGGARGTDQIAMQASVSRGGSSLGVLTHPLTKAAREAEARELADEGRLCLVTPYRPDMGFTVANAMARNKIIYGLAECTVVVAADLDKGGSWAGAVEALRGEFSRVAVWTGEGAGSGNAALVEKGAISIDDVSQVLEAAVLDSRKESSETQLRLIP